MINENNSNTENAIFDYMLKQRNGHYTHIIEVPSPLDIQSTIESFIEEFNEKFTRQDFINFFKSLEIIAFDSECELTSEQENAIYDFNVLECVKSVCEEYTNLALININIPFSGFYESIHDSNIDHAIECDIENAGLAETAAGDIDYKPVRLAICKLYIEAYNRAFKDKHDIDLNLEFVELNSPRFYNFDTDKIIAAIDKDVFKQVTNLVNKEEMQNTLRDKFKPCSGFSPFTSTLEAIEEFNAELFAFELLESLLSEEEVLNKYYHYNDNVSTAVTENIAAELYTGQDDEQ